MIIPCSDTVCEKHGHMRSTQLLCSDCKCASEAGFLATQEVH